MKLSVVVPVYNVSEFLRQGIDSVLSQSFRDFELILVDDGSSDDSGSICDEYAAKDCRIKVIHKENGGACSARNAGLDQAVGEWVYFFDPDDELYPDSPIAAYTSYYNMADTEKNHNRIHNIRTGCGYISKVLQTGEKFDANDVMGPYSARNGYKQAGVLTDGEAALGYGGGTCQVSSTLYNVLIQLPGIEIIHRRPHGASGASYLPIHCDAAVGNQELNLIFKNNYTFPIRIVATSHDDGALLVKIYVAHELSE